ncbi:unnamed protein product [Notodromas monacha]|uniref:TRASH domain-containing protein n=1 Tax=Notodromas monacha TaxID=399045 RepID=A0A7R9BEU3_9CRUS|nr:unnamed protein product [Notodromas monacha]CAG0914068.1 unnamed protein product [Notodromas monacha]
MADIAPEEVPIDSLELTHESKVSSNAPLDVPSASNEIPAIVEHPPLSDASNVLEAADSLLNELAEVSGIPEDTPECIQGNVPKTVQEEVSESVLESVSESVAETLSESVAETLSESVPETLPEAVPENFPESSPENLNQSLTENTSPDFVPENVPELASENVPELGSENMLQAVPDTLPEPMEEDLPQSMSETMPESLQETLPESMSDSLDQSHLESAHETLPESIQEALPVSIQKKFPESIHETSMESLDEHVSEGSPCDEKPAVVDISSTPSVVDVPSSTEEQTNELLPPVKTVESSSMDSIPSTELVSEVNAPVSEKEGFDVSSQEDIQAVDAYEKDVNSEAVIASVKLSETTESFNPAESGTELPRNDEPMESDSVDADVVPAKETVPDAEPAECKLSETCEEPIQTSVLSPKNEPMDTSSEVIKEDDLKVEDSAVPDKHEEKPAEKRVGPRAKSDSRRMNGVSKANKQVVEIPETSTPRSQRKAAIKAGSTIKNFVRKEASNMDELDFPFATELEQPDDLCYDGQRCVFCRRSMSKTHQNLFWEGMEFCNSSCLEKLQKKIGSSCVNCGKRVTRQYLGKYCVRLGARVRQFCTNPCLEEFKRGMKTCSNCQVDLADVNEPLHGSIDNKATKYCSVWCKEKNTNEREPSEARVCSVCLKVKPVECEILMSTRDVQNVCSEICLSAFKFAEKCSLDKCKTCDRYVNVDGPMRSVVATCFESEIFCSRRCSNVHFISSREIVPCAQCKVKKYNYDMIEQLGEGGRKSIHFCSLHCYDAHAKAATKYTGGRGLRIASVESLSDASSGSNLPYVALHDIKSREQSANQKVMLMRPPARAVRNKAVVCKPSMVNKGISTKLGTSVNKTTQTDEDMGKPIIIPIPVPVYVPSPMAMYNAPYPFPMALPLPVPVPIFIPTTRKTSERIGKDIKRILKKVPADPLEAELLMMAQAVGEGVKEEEDSEEDEDDVDDYDGGEMSEEEERQDEVPVRNSGSMSRLSGEDILQTALRTAVDDTIGTPYLAESSIDVEQALAGATPAVTKSLDPPKRPSFDDVEAENQMRRMQQQQQQQQRSPKKRQRSSRGTPRGGGSGGGSGGIGRAGKRMRTDYPNDRIHDENRPPEHISEPMPPEDRPDANMMLKYTFGVNAWRFWVQRKNEELEKLQAANPMRRIRLFKKDLLQLSCEELCYALCFFVKEVKKPDDSMYSPDLVYYLCLGIQEYLLENGRVENIFNDQLFEKFTDCLDEITCRFSGQQMLTDLGYIMTHIEEEHLWEAKQLGAHSPHVLLNTLMYFTTKNFLLTAPKDHVRLSFPHVMKHWKKGPGVPPGRGGHNPAMGSQRNVLLKYYPPASIRAEMGERAKRSYEMHENGENPLRCPIRLYEFYLSKCPESIKGKNEVFYLFPERSCVPHSPVWYSTQPLSEQVISKMLHRITLVREIQDAIINDQ